jgi:hypothetical protein
MNSKSSGENCRENEYACFNVIARSEATKQSSFFCHGKKAGLLRFARNDGGDRLFDN